MPKTLAERLTTNPQRWLPTAVVGAGAKPPFDLGALGRSLRADADLPWDEKLLGKLFAKDQFTTQEKAPGQFSLEPKQRTTEEAGEIGLGEMDFEVVRAADSTEKDSVLDFIGSTAAQDSYGDVILVKGWKLDRYKRNPVFMPVHQYGVLPLGRSLKTWKEDGALKFRIQFATDLEGAPGQIAREWYDAYLKKYVRGSSVGFLPLVWRRPTDDKEREKFNVGPYGFIFEEQELLELSAAPVPSNPEALVQLSAMAQRGALPPAFLEQLRSVVRSEVIEVLRDVTDGSEDPPSEEEPVEAPVTKTEDPNTVVPSASPVPDYSDILSQVRSAAAQFAPAKVAGQGQAVDQNTTQ